MGEELDSLKAQVDALSAAKPEELVVEQVLSVPTPATEASPERPAGGGGHENHQDKRRGASRTRRSKPTSPYAESDPFDKPKISYVDLFKDMERMRSIIECMEQTMPLHVRQSISFFKGCRKPCDTEQIRPDTGTSKKDFLGSDF